MRLPIKPSSTELSPHTNGKYQRIIDEKVPEIQGTHSINVPPPIQPTTEPTQKKCYEALWFNLFCALLISVPTAFTAFVSRLGGKVDELKSFDDLTTLWNGSDQKVWAINSLCSSEFVNSGVNYYFLIPNFIKAAKSIAVLVRASFSKIKSCTCDRCRNAHLSEQDLHPTPQNEYTTIGLNLFYLIWAITNGLAFSQISKDSFKFLQEASYIPFFLAFGQYFTTRLNGMEVTRPFFLRLSSCSNHGASSVPGTVRVVPENQDPFKTELASDLSWFQEKKTSRGSPSLLDAGLPRSGSQLIDGRWPVDFEIENSQKRLSSAMRNFLVRYYADVNDDRQFFIENKSKYWFTTLSALPLAIWIGLSIWPVMVPKIIGGGESLLNGVDIGHSHEYKDPASILFGYLFGSATAFFYARSSYYLAMRLFENTLMIKQIWNAAKLSGDYASGSCNALLWVISMLGCHWFSYWSGDGMMGVVKAEIKNNYLSYLAALSSFMINSGFIAAWFTNLSPCMDLLNSGLGKRAASSLDLDSIHTIDLATARLVLQHQRFRFEENDYKEVHIAWKKRRAKISAESCLTKLFKCCDERRDPDDLNGPFPNQAISTP